MDHCYGLEISSILKYFIQCSNFFFVNENEKYDEEEFSEEEEEPE